MAAGVPDGLSSRGGSSTRSADLLFPLPRMGEPTPTTRSSPGTSSERRTEASRSSAYHAICDGDLGKQEAVGWRGRNYRRRSSSSYDSHETSPTDHRPVSSSTPVSCRGIIKENGGGDASSFATLEIEEGPGKLLISANSIKAPATHQGIIKQGPMPTLLEMIGAPDASHERRLPKVSEEEDDMDDQKDCHMYHMSSGAPDASHERRLPKVSEEEDDMDDQKDCHMYHMSSESDGSSEGAYQSVEEMEPSALREKIRITLKNPKPPSIPRPGCVFTKEFLGQYPSSGKGTRAGTSTTQSAAGTDSTAGHGDPHPPPFIKCQVCRRRTAFYRLKCCHQVICEHCGCECDPDDMEDADRRSQVAKREKLPKVKLEGSNLFLWKHFKFPSDLMLCKAKGDGKVIQYTFASIEDLMDGRNRTIPDRVYTFKVNGTWTVSNEML